MNLFNLIKINPATILISLTCLALFILTANGTLQNIIHFAGIDEEIGFAFILLFGSAISLLASFEKVEK